MSSKNKLFRITTIPLSLHKLLHNQLRYVSSYYDVAAVASPGEFMEQVKKNEGVQFHPVPMTRTIAPLKDMVALWRLYRLFRNEKPLIVHSQTLKGGLLGMIAARLAGVPIRMQTVAGLQLLETPGFKKWILIAVEKITYSCASRIYPNSFRLKEILEEKGLCKSSKLSVIGNGSSNGIDGDFFCPAQISAEQKQKLRSELQLAPDDIVMCFIGRMVKDKGINELVASFVKLADKISNIKLLLVGPLENELDPLLPETERLLKTHPAIKWTGFQNDVRPFLAVSDIFVFPSYREGFPNVVMQAGAMGLPCIVSNINGCNEIIQQNLNGLIVPSKNADALHEAMKQLIADKQTRERLASSSREMVIQRYSQQFFWQELVKEYNRMEKEKGIAV